MSVMDVTTNLKTVLKTTDSYGGTPTVEEQRYFEAINDRYPYIILAGPETDKERGMNNRDNTAVDYQVKYHVDVGDEDLNQDPLVYLTRNVTGDLRDVLMADPTRGNNAQNTQITHSGYSFDVIGDPDGGSDIEFYVYLALKVFLFTDSNNPYLLG